MKEDSTISSVILSFTQSLTTKYKNIALQLHDISHRNLLRLRYDGTITNMDERTVYNITMVLDEQLLAQQNHSSILHFKS